MADTKITTSSPEPKNAPSKRRLIVAGIAALVVLVFGGLLISGQVSFGRKVYAEAAGTKIYKEDVQKLIGDNQGITDNQAATVLADKYLSEAMARQQNLTINRQDLEKVDGQGGAEVGKSDPYTNQANLNGLYFSKLAAYNRGAFKGQLLVAHFSRNVAYESPLLAEKKSRNPSLGNPSIIAADKKAAQNVITNLYTQIESGKITFDEAIKQERANPIVGEVAYPTLSHSGTFDTTTNEQNSILNTESIRDKLGKIKPGETTKPFVVRVANSSSDNSTAESFYLVIKMDASSGGGSGMSFEQQLEKAKKQLGYKINV